MDVKDYLKTNKTKATNDGEIVIVQNSKVVITDASDSVHYIKGGGTSAIEVDSVLSLLSTNPVQNKVIKTALDKKQDKIVNNEFITTQEVANLFEEE